MSAPILFGVTAAIGGAQLAAAACFTAACTVTGALADMPVIVTPRTFPGNGTFWYGYVSAPDTVTVKLCNAEAGFVLASIFDVAVINAAGSSPGGPALQVNGVANADQALLNLQQGTGITITDAGAGGVLITGLGGPTTQNVNPAGRAYSTVYHNTGATARFVMISTLNVTGTGGNFTVFSDTSNPPTTQVLQVSELNTGNIIAIELFFIVLPGNFYSVTPPTGAVGIDTWTEYN